MSKNGKKSTVLYFIIPFIMIGILCIAIFVPNLFNSSNSNSNQNAVLVFDTVYGYVRDLDQNPVDNVVLSLDNGKSNDLKSTTDNEGAFCFYNIPADVYELKILTLPSDEYLKPSKNITVDLYSKEESNYQVGTIYLNKSSDGGSWGPLV